MQDAFILHQPLKLVIVPRSGDVKLVTIRFKLQFLKRLHCNVHCTHVFLILSTVNEF